jgi:hypothetical protein
MLVSPTGKGDCMLRPFIVTAILLTVSITGLYTVAGSIAAAREGKAATFSERFAPVLKPAT